MSKHLHKTIPAGTKLTFTGDDGNYFTKGNKYKIRECTINYKLDDDSGQGTHYWDERILDSFELPKEETKPVYTQEMADNGGSLTVGMLFQGVDTKEVPCVCKCLAIGGESNDLCVLYSYDKGKSICSCWLNDSWVKPLDNRTPIEVTFDNMMIEMTRRFELNKDKEDHLCNDDTQEGVEFAIQYMKTRNIQIIGAK